MFLKRPLTYILLILYFSAKGQDYQIGLKHWDVRDGLSHRQVNGICQDNRGFIWVGTQYGLDCFDGYAFKVYTKENDGLPFNIVERIAIDADGFFWLVGGIGENNNIAIFDPFTKQVTTLKSKTGYDGSIHADFLKKINDSTLIFGNSTEHFFFTWNPRLGLHKIAYPVPVKRLISITENNTFWAQVGSGELCEIDSHGTLKTKLDAPGKMEDLLPLLPGRGLIQTGSFTSRSIFKVTAALPPIAQKTFGKSAVGDYDRSFPETDTNFEDIIFNTGIDEIIYRQGKLYDPRKGILMDYINKGHPELKSIARQVMVDNSGRIWIGNNYGLYMLTLSGNHFRKYFSEDVNLYKMNACRNIVVDNKNVYVCNEDFGVRQANIQPAKKDATIFSRPPKTKEYNTLVKTHEGTLVGIQSKYVYSLAKKSHKWALWALPEEQNKNKFWKIYQVTTDSFLLGTSNGLEWLNIKTHRFSPFTQYHQYSELTSSIIMDILPGNNGKAGNSSKVAGSPNIVSSPNLWICSYTGLYEYTPAGGVIARYSSADTGSHFLPAKEFHHLCLDVNGFYWIATTRGLVKWDKRNAQYRLFTRKDGLSNDNIYAVYEDGLGRLWMSSDYGIMQFNKATGNVKSYLTDAGITDNEFNRVSHAMDSSGNIYFGSLNGVTVFNPKDFPVNDECNNKPMLAITSFEQFNSRTNRLEDQTGTLIKTGTITLNPEDRFFNMSFALLTFVDVLHTTYFWHIDGLDTGWNSKNEPVLRLSGLPNGKWILRIKARAIDGSWGRNELMFNINVIKPYYERTWFIVLCLVALISGFAGLYWWRIFRLKKENERLDKIVKEKTFALEETIKDLRISTKQKDMLMKEIHHRVKNNLQVISTLLNLQMKGIKDEEARVSIEEGVSRISSIALIHHHLYKTDNLSAIEMAEFAKELLRQVTSVYLKPGHKIALQNDIPETWLDIDTALPLGLMLNELMTNSYKYAYVNTMDVKLLIKLSLVENEYTLEYFDNGPGLPSDYEVETAGSLGMTILKSLSKQLGGSFSYRKEDNCFVVTFLNSRARKNID